MHEVTTFAKDIFKGLWQAIKTDIDVFLMAFAGLIWPFKTTRGLSLSTFLYVIVRRIDGIATAFVSVKRKEIKDAEATEQN